MEHFWHCCHAERDRRIAAAMTAHAHFDDKVIVPDEPLDLARIRPQDSHRAA